MAKHKTILVSEDVYFILTGLKGINEAYDGVIKRSLKAHLFETRLEEARQMGAHICEEREKRRDE